MLSSISTSLTSPCRSFSKMPNCTIGREKVDLLLAIGAALLRIFVIASGDAKPKVQLFS